MIKYKVLQLALAAAMLFAVMTLNAQDVNYARHQLNTICSPEFYGRAYFHKGDSLASDYISSELKKQGVKPFGQTLFQPYSFGVNILEEVSVKINSKELKFGKDYMMDASSGSSSGIFRPLMVNATLMKNPQKLLDSIVNNSCHNDVIVLDSTGLKNPELYRFLKTFILNGMTKSSGLIEITPKIGIGLVGDKELPVSHVQIDSKVMPESLTNVELNIRNRFDADYSTRNVIGYIPGQTDKFIVFTAHYDGIGSFGNGNYFPAASDNASGTVMVMDLARYFANGKKPYYSIAIMLFSGEEAGLLGSSYYADHPLFPLDKIKLVINLDMVGTGQEGVVLFNGTERPIETSIAQSINEKKQYMKSIDVVGPAANSDHHPFHLKNVPAIFFLTKGPSGGGHNTGDTFDKLPLYSYNNLFRLVLDMIKELENQELK